VISADKPYHHGNLRAALLERAEEMLATTGVSGLSLRELAREAGVSHGAPRRHFPDKQALLDAMAENGFERLGRELEATMGAAEGTFTERLVVFAQTYVHFAARHPALLTLMHTSNDRPDAQHLREANDRAFAAPLALLADARRVGDIVDADTDRVSMAVLAMLQGLAVLVTTGMSGERSVDTLVADSIEALVEGLRPRIETTSPVRHGRARLPGMSSANPSAKRG
jgi:AcrR family transcriptional regulator